MEKPEAKLQSHESVSRGMSDVEGWKAAARNGGQVRADPAGSWPRIR